MKSGIIFMYCGLMTVQEVGTYTSKKVQIMDAHLIGL
jgi:hypothetical protein